MCIVLNMVLYGFAVYISYGSEGIIPEPLSVLAIVSVHLQDF